MLLKLYMKYYIRMSENLLRNSNAKDLHVDACTEFGPNHNGCITIYKCNIENSSFVIDYN